MSTSGLHGQIYATGLSPALSHNPHSRTHPPSGQKLFPLWEPPTDVWWPYVLCLVAKDFEYYWAHRLMHTNAFLWIGHQVSCTGTAGRHAALAALAACVLPSPPAHFCSAVPPLPKVHHSSDHYNLTTALRQSWWQQATHVLELTLAPFFPLKMLVPCAAFNTLYQVYYAAGRPRRGRGQLERGS